MTSFKKNFRGVPKAERVPNFRGYKIISILITIFSFFGARKYDSAIFIVLFAVGFFGSIYFCNKGSTLKVTIHK